MQLFADRFAIDDDERAMDLATGRRVEIRRCDGDRSARVQWSVRCDRWLALRHRAIARLLDYGLAGPAGAFEAWDCGCAWGGADQAAERARDIGSRFVAAAGMSVESALAIHSDGARAVAVLGANDGYARETADDDARSMPLAMRGMVRIPRTAIAACAEMFDSASERRPTVASVWGAAGAGKRTVVLELARLARLKGVVPIASRLHPHLADLVRDRNLLIVHDVREEWSQAWRSLLQSTLRSALPHVLLLVGDEEIPRVNGIALGAVPPDDLIAAVYPQPLDPRMEQRARRAAIDSRGLPGRFVRLLWPDWSDDRSGARRGRGARAAENAAVYGSDEPEPPAPLAVAEPAGSVTWPLPGELAALRQRVDAAMLQLTSGRHAPAIRQLRQAASAFARRDGWSEAASALLSLARAQLARGRPSDAIATLNEAQRQAERSHSDAALLDIAILTGEARIDLLRFDEAETLLAAAVTTATHAHDSSRHAAASIGLARCLFWRGEYIEAAAALNGGESAAAFPFRSGRLRARIDVGRGDVAGAMTTVAALTRQMDGGTDAAVRAAVACTSAFVRIAVGDLDAALDDVRGAIATARAAHDPLRSLRARLFGVEIERRLSHRSAAVAQLNRLRRLRPSLPPLLGARFDAIDRLLSSAADPKRSHAAASSARALTLYAGNGACRAAADPAIDDVLVILRACQTAEEEAVVLRDVCAHVRRQLRAIGAAFVGSVDGGRTLDVTAFDGSRIEMDIARRAMAASIVIRPHRHGDRVDGAAPVLYGGAAIGALCARWSIGSTFDAGRGASVLAMAATAAAPMMAAALAHRRASALPEASGVATLRGVTAAMQELRRATERAGAAPFGVLIVGESGSGKELVARAIHRSSPRRGAPFCSLNCAALPDDLVESELFGHVRGAFTGAIAERPGVFEEAHGGTLFLDEIGELSARAQAKILRVIQEGELRRVGENLPRRVDVRLIAATNRDLAREVELGRFRLDLLYRLDVIRIAVPPLRDRAEDIAVLAAHFWSDATAHVHSRATLAPATVAALARYHWPGNVRELQNVLSALAVRSPRRGIVPPAALPPHFHGASSRDETWRLDHARRTFEERFVRAALVRTGGHRSRAAAELGVSRQGLSKLLARLGIADAP